VLVLPSIVPPPALEPLLRRRAFLLLPVLGRELVAYHLDFASSIGEEKVLILTEDRPEEVRAFVGDGRAWGLSVDVVAMSGLLSPAEQLSRAGAGPEALFLAPDALVPPLGGDREKREPPSEDWVDRAGWVLARGRDAVPRPGARMIPSRRMADPRTFLDVQIALLADAGGFSLPGFAVAPGIVVSTGCKLSLASVKEVPVFVGAHARVSDKADLASGVVVGPRCLVDDEASLVRCVVLPRTYVGRLLAGHDLILDGGLIVNAATGGAAAIADDLLLADLDRPIAGDRLVRLGRRVAGVFLALVSLPLLALAWLKSASPRIVTRTVYSGHQRLAVDGTPERLTAEVHEFSVPNLLLRRLGWLLDLAKGDLSVVGPPPLSPERAASLEPELRDRWLEAAPGVFGLAQSEALAAGRAVDANAEAVAAALQAGSGSSGAAGYVLRGIGLAFTPRAWRARA
jgi:hypothetical protein